MALFGARALDSARTLDSEFNVSVRKTRQLCKLTLRLVEKVHKIIKIKKLDKNGREKNAIHLPLTKNYRNSFII